MLPPLTQCRNSFCQGKENNFRITAQQTSSQSSFPCCCFPAHPVHVGCTAQHSLCSGCTQSFLRWWGNWEWGCTPAGEDFRPTRSWEAQLLPCAVIPPADVRQHPPEVSGCGYKTARAGKSPAPSSDRGDEPHSPRRPSLPAELTAPVVPLALPKRPSCPSFIAPLQPLTRRANGKAFGNFQLILAGNE